MSRLTFCFSLQPHSSRSYSFHFIPHAFSTRPCPCQLKLKGTVVMTYNLLTQKATRRKVTNASRSKQCTAVEPRQTDCGRNYSGMTATYIMCVNWTTRARSSAFRNCRLTFGCVVAIAAAGQAVYNDRCP